MAKAEKEAVHWTAAIESLPEKRAKLEGEREKAEAERKALALGHHTGDKAASEKFGNAEPPAGPSGGTWARRTPA